VTEHPGYILSVVCDDPRHARGKVASIATFGRFTLPNGEVRWLVRDGDEWSYTVRPRDGGRVRAHRRYDAEPELGSTYTWTCNLCPRSLKAREGTLQGLLETTWGRRGELTAGGLLKPVDGVSSISIYILDLLASSIAGHQ
jgi:hypothetical protein